MKVKLYVFAEKSFLDNEFKLKTSTYDECEWSHDTSDIKIPLSEIEIDVPVPELNQKQLVGLEVEQLQEKIKKEMADSHVRITAIEEKIQSLLCIENGG